jgi:squalene-hopene/tetraprenyl-beta-curcumene cyclase
MNGGRIVEQRFARTRSNTLRRLLESRDSDGLWTGRLSSSPLATAVAIVALHTVDTKPFASCIQKGTHGWRLIRTPTALGRYRKQDPSNLSTTLLAMAALCAVDTDARNTAPAAKGRTWLKSKLNYNSEADLAEAVYDAYGADRTFAVPILTHCALAGLFARSADAWRFVKPLPFELAQLPQGLYRVLNLGVVSYALPALIAVGQVKFHFDPPKNVIVRTIRQKACKPTLRLLNTIQPPNGGFLEAPPLTGFVTMSLAAVGQRSHPVVQKGTTFLTAAMRPDGSWPIDTNLSTWLTTHAIKLLAPEELSPDQRDTLTAALLRQQHKTTHPFTDAAPGGWGWSGLPGAVPDADDTAGALAALHRLQEGRQDVRQAAWAGLTWLLDLQNADGGMPTFCRAGESSNLTEAAPISQRTRLRPLSCGATRSGQH